MQLNQPNFRLHYTSVAVRLRDDLCGGVPTGAILRTLKQRFGNALGRAEDANPAPPTGGSTRQRHWCLA